MLLDLNELGRGKKFVGLGAFVVSDDQNLLAYTIDYVGYRQFNLHVKDLRSGEELPDTTDRVTSIQWAGDNRTLLLTTEDAITKRSDRLSRLTLGQALAPVYDETDALFRIRVSKTRDKKYVLLNIRSTDSSEVRYLRADQPQANFAVFLPREKKHRYDIDHRENLFYIHTNQGAKNFRVVTAPADDPRPANWRGLCPAQ